MTQPIASAGPHRLRVLAGWGVVLAVMAVPLIIAAQSPLLQWRQPIYILSGFAGVLGLALLFVQPLLARGALGGLTPARSRQIHIWGGALLCVTLVVHVGGLWITSPPDVVDALLFRSPTPFSFWGVVAMWSVIVTALLAATRRRLRLRPETWRRAHLSLAVLTVGCTIVHALWIDGTMGTASKVGLCVLTALTLIYAVRQRRIAAQR